MKDNDPWDKDAEDAPEDDKPYDYYGKRFETDVEDCGINEISEDEYLELE